MSRGKNKNTDTRRQRARNEWRGRRRQEGGMKGRKGRECARGVVRVRWGEREREREREGGRDGGRDRERCIS
jgi:hypothetical protein